MIGSKPLASLSSTLLARKGMARPAMRPQGFGGVGAPLAPRSVSVATVSRIRRETNAKHVADGRSAFTLGVDSDRHLKLRLARALQNKSAQLLLTEALDAFLETLPEVDTLVSQLPGRAKA